MIYYWLAILDNMKSCFSTVCFVSVMTTVMTIVFYIAGVVNNEDDLIKAAKKPCKISWTVLILSALLTTFVPSQKQAAFIVVAPAIVENKDIQETFKNIPELTKLGTDYLVEMLKDAKKISDQ